MKYDFLKGNHQDSTFLNELALKRVILQKQIDELDGDFYNWAMSPENNVFPNIEDAEDWAEDSMEDEARFDCEGAYNCGNDEYERFVTVDDEIYKITGEFEYNRHDKTYYYIDGRKFKTEKV